MYIASRAARILEKPVSIVILFAALVAISVLCLERFDAPLNVRQLTDIRKAGKIRMITRNNANCYYSYRDQPMGFEYDLAKAFADYLHVGLEVRVAESWDSMIPDLLSHKGDFIAAGMTDTPARRKKVAFSNPYLENQQHMIVRRRSSDFKTEKDLAGQTVHVRKGTSYQERLEALQQKGIDFTLVVHDDLPTEDLIRMVAQEEIPMTIADTQIAYLNRRYYPQAIVAGPISRKQSVAWAVSPNAGGLLREINAFFREIKKNGVYDRIYDRYFKNIDHFDFFDLQKYHYYIDTRLPQYQEIIRQNAEKYGFDWRFIAAQIYQESHFNPEARSYAGARGLMQLLPSTARDLGVSQLTDPYQNVRAGVRYLHRLYAIFDQARGDDRLALALAAYNIGQGHVYDARDLARQRGLDPDKWDALAQTLPLLRYRKYYKNSKYGYCRGTEPVTYVRQVMLYYDILKRRSIEYEVPPEGETREEPYIPQA